MTDLLRASAEMSADVRRASILTVGRTAFSEELSTACERFLSAVAQHVIDQAVSFIATDLMYDWKLDQIWDDDGGPAYS